MDFVFSLSVNYPYIFKGRNSLKALFLLLLSNLWSCLGLPERESMKFKMAYKERCATLAGRTSVLS